MVSTRHAQSDSAVIDEGDAYRHWSPDSEKFTSGEALFNALRDGWQVDGVIFRQDYWHRGGRRVPVYHFNLVRHGKHSKMVIIQNPFVDRLVQNSGIQVVLLNQRKMVGHERW
jgi:hypothetical protein